MNKEELRTFKLLSNRIKTPNVRKDFLLLSYSKRKGKEYNEGKISKKLYGDNKNAFYKLKEKGLYDLCYTIFQLAEKKLKN
jgi:hypothetical protein